MDNNVKEVYIVGLMAEGCVRASIRRLKSENFDVTIIEDAIGTRNQSRKKAIINKFRKQNINVALTNEI